MLTNDIGAWPKPKVEGITENNLCADIGDVAGQHALYRAIRPDRHKRRGLHTASREIDLPAPGVSVLMGDPKLH